MVGAHAALTSSRHETKNRRDSNDSVGVWGVWDWPVWGWRPGPRRRSRFLRRNTTGARGTIGIPSGAITGTGAPAMTTTTVTLTPATTAATGGRAAAATVGAATPVGAAVGTPATVGAVAAAEA